MLEQKNESVIKNSQEIQTLIMKFLLSNNIAVIC